jgi:thiol-disulfide isomerase/thioredoxin
MFNFKFYFSTILVMVFNRAWADDNFSIIGRIKNAKNSTIQLNIIEEKYPYKLHVNTVDLDVAGNFTFYTTLNHLSEIILNIEGTSVLIVGKPEYNLILNADASYIKETLKFAGKGSAINNFRVEYNAEFENDIDLLIKQGYIRDFNTDEYTDYIDNLYKKKLDFLMVKNAQMPFGNEEYNFERIRIEYENYEKLLYFTAQNAYENRLNKPLEPSTKMQSAIYNVKINQEQHTKNPYYISFCCNLLQYEYERKIQKEMRKPILYEQYILAKQMFNSNTLQYVTFDLINNAFGLQQYQQIETVYKQYMEQCNLINLCDFLKQRHEYSNVVESGKPINNFSFIDESGAQHYISDFVGKAVYIDFWASWCIPCIDQIPEFKKLEKEFAEKNINFIKINLDNSSFIWQKKSKDLQIEENNFFAPNSFKSESAKAFNVTSIPAFFILDKNGSVFNANPDRPSGSEIRKQLNQVLNVK